MTMLCVNQQVHAQAAVAFERLGASMAGMRTIVVMDTLLVIFYPVPGSSRVQAAVMSADMPHRLLRLFPCLLPVLPLEQQLALAALAAIMTAVLLVSHHMPYHVCLVAAGVSAADVA